MKSSSPGGPTLVNPQPIRWLWPTITKGIPGSVTPATSKLPVFVGVVVLRWASNHRFGIWWSRCISFDSSGFPETVCCPEMTQLLDPGRRESSKYPAPEEYPAPKKYPAPEGRPSLAQRFSVCVRTGVLAIRWNEELDNTAPEGRTNLAQRFSA